MDCRLEDLATNLSTNILPYMTNLFRKLYKYIFGDNDFRLDYAGKNQLTENDCEQLLQNIFIVSKTQQFCNLLRKEIVTKATYKPTENDKFNLYGDDALQRKKFNEKDDSDTINMVKQLFDDITVEELVDFYRSRSV